MPIEQRIKPLPSLHWRMCGGESIRTLIYAPIIPRRRCAVRPSVIHHTHQIDELRRDGARALRGIARPRKPCGNIILEFFAFIFLMTINNGVESSNSADLPPPAGRDVIREAAKYTPHGWWWR